VPKWAFRPEKSTVVAHAQQRLQCGRQKAPENKADTLKRARLDANLEAFINIGSTDAPGWQIFIVNCQCTYSYISLCP